MGCKAYLVKALVHSGKTDIVTPTKSFCMSAEIGDDGYRT